MKIGILQSMLCAKAVAVVILDTLGLGEDAASDLLKWEFYLFVLLLISFLLLQTHFLNFTLKRFDALLVLPIYTVTIIMVRIFHPCQPFQIFKCDCVVSSG